MSVRHLYPGFYTALWIMPLFALLQTSLMGHLAVRGIIPGIVLILVVNWGILRGPDEGMLWAFLGGLCLDLFTSWPFGTNTVALVIVAGLVSLGQGTFMRTHALLPPATVFGATILFYLMALFILESAHYPVDWIAAIRATIIPAALYNAVLNVILFPLTRRLEERTYPVPRAKW